MYIQMLAWNKISSTLPLSLESLVFKDRRSKYHRYYAVIIVPAFSVRYRPYNWSQALGGTNQLGKKREISISEISRMPYYVNMLAEECSTSMSKPHTIIK